VNPLEAVKSIKRPSLKRPSLKPPSFEMPSFSMPSPWVVGAVLLVVVWIAWAIFTAADRGADAGLGVLVAWPTLILMVTVVVAPLAIIAFLIARLVSQQRRDAITDAGGEPDDDIITGGTSPP
jgi:hypothetical protein